MEERLSKYEPMWTEELHRYALVDMGDGEGGALLIFDTEKSAPVVIDDDPMVVESLIRRLRSAGVKLLRASDVVPK